MFAAQMRRAVERAPRADLARLSTTIWKAWGAGALPDDEAQGLSDLIAARKALPPPSSPPQRRVGSRPRSPASMERRRSCAASGFLPPHLQARFTPGESAALAVAARQVAKHGACTLALDHLAAIAGVSRATVKRAIRAAEALGILRVEERRLTAWRNLPHRITVTSREWSAWLAHRRRGVEFNSEPPRISGRKEGAAYRPQRAAEEGGRGWQRRERPGREGRNGGWIGE